MRWFLICLMLSGCAVTPMRACVAADVATTAYGLHSGRLVERLSPFKASMNAGHLAPFVLASVVLVLLVERWSEPTVTAVTGVECGLAAHNLLVIR